MHTVKEVLREPEVRTTFISSGKFGEGFTEDVACDLNLEHNFSRFGKITHFKQRKRYFLLRRPGDSIKILLVHFAASLILRQAPEWQASLFPMAWEPNLTCCIFVQTSLQSKNGFYIFK